MPDPTFSSNTFAALPLIAAPAILTNAASVLAMSTSNRFLRASERLHAVGARLEDSAESEEARVMLARQIPRIESQAVMLLSGLRAAYVALASFALASLISIVGAALDAQGLHPAAYVTVFLGLLCGFLGAGGLAHACFLLFRATRLSMQNISEEAQLIRRQHTRPVAAAAPRKDAAELRDEP